MPRKKAPLARLIRTHCNHPARYIEVCSDGVYCTVCCEGLCPLCRRLWRDDAPTCSCRPAPAEAIAS